MHYIIKFILNQSRYNVSRLNCFSGSTAIRSNNMHHPSSTTITAYNKNKTPNPYPTASPNTQNITQHNIQLQQQQQQLQQSSHQQHLVQQQKTAINAIPYPNNNNNNTNHNIDNNKTAILTYVSSSSNSLPSGTTVRVLPTMSQPANAHLSSSVSSNLVSPSVTSSTWKQISNWKNVSISKIHPVTKSRSQPYPKAAVSNATSVPVGSPTRASPKGSHSKHPVPPLISVTSNQLSHNRNCNNNNNNNKSLIIIEYLQY